MEKSLYEFLKKRYNNQDFITHSHVKNGKDHLLVLEFEESEIIKITVRERDGQNGNYRVTVEA